jgi:hypothetical protein
MPLIAPLSQRPPQHCWSGTAFYSPGCTSRLQPPDRRIFRVLKAHFRELWRTHYHVANGAKTTSSMMAEKILTAWERIHPEIIEISWDVFQETWENGDSDELNHRNADAKFRPLMKQQDPEDLE